MDFIVENIFIVSNVCHSHHYAKAAISLHGQSALQTVHAGPGVPLSILIFTDRSVNIKAGKPRGWHCTDHRSVQVAAFKFLIGIFSTACFAIKE